MRFPSVARLGVQGRRGDARGVLRARRGVVASVAVAPGDVLSELEKLALRLGITVRFEPFNAKAAAKGGLCRLRGEPLIVIDVTLPVMDKIGILSQALSAFDLEAIYVPPVVRARVRVDTRLPSKASRSPVRPPLRGPVKAVRRPLIHG